MKDYIQRSIEPILDKAVKQYPAVLLTGPRQSGKTTLLKRFFSSSYKYISLEPPDIRAAATADPRGFINLYSPPVIFDEIQYAPDLFYYIKEKIDERRDVYGQYILTGSQNILLMQQVVETLAGRVATLRLLPLSYNEMIGSPFDLFPWEKNSLKSRKNPLSLSDFWKLMLRGSYPELAEHPEKESALWHGSYIQTYLERDVRTLKNIGDLTQFQFFLRSVAARSGQLFHYSEVAKELGLSLNTIKAWLSILEATYQIFVLRPYFANISKRLVKTPKIYFTDVGTLCYLSGLRDTEHLVAGPMAGTIVETFVVSEIYKRLSHRGREPLLSFWRTASGTEVDLLIEEQGKLIPIEIKASSTPKPQMAEGIIAFQKDLEDKATTGYIVNLGELFLPLAKSVLAIPLRDL